MALDPSRAWQRDHPWARIYQAVTGGERVGALLWRLGTGAGVGELHRHARRELEALPPGSRVLDVPCGGGIALQDVPRGRDLRYVAADISPAMLHRTAREAAARGVDGVVVREADMQNLSDPDGAYDLVLTFTSLHCVPDPERAVHELARVLAPGGRLCGSIFSTDAGLRFLPVHTGGRAIGVLGPGATRREVQQWLVDAGFVDVELEVAGGITYFHATRS